MTKRTFFLALILLLAGTALQRIHVSRSLVDRGDEPPALLGVDAYFHVRAAQYTAEHFPHHLREEGAAFFPDFRKQSVSGTLNVLHAALIQGDMLTTGADLRRAAYRTGAWLPVALACLVMLSLVLLVGRLGSRDIAILSGGALLIFPGSFLARSAYGFLDQHVLEALLAVLTVWGLVATVESRGHWSIAALSALAPALFLFSWLGASVYFLHMAVFILVLLIATPRAGDRLYSTSVALGRYCALASLYVAAILVLLPDWALEIREGIRWAWPFAFALLGLVGWGYGRIITRQKWAERTRRMATVILVLVGGTLLLAAIPPLRQLLFRSFEHQAPDVTELSLAPLNVLHVFGPALPLALIGWLSQWKSRSPVHAATAAYALIPLALWLSSGDFDYVPPVFIALYGGVGFYLVMDWIPGPAALRTGLSLAVLLGLIWPLGWVADPASIDDSREAILLYDDAWYEAMEWLRTETEEPARVVNTKIGSADDLIDGRADYGVMTSWLHGNAVHELGRRSPRFARFPSPWEPTWFLSRTPEEERAARCPNCRPGQTVRYAALDVSLAAELYPMKLMRARGMKSVPEPERDPATEGQPRYSEAYREALAVRLVTAPASVRGITPVFQSVGRSLLYYEFNAESGALARRSFRLNSGRLPPWTDIGTDSRMRYYGIDTVHSVQIFRIDP